MRDCGRSDVRDLLPDVLHGRLDQAAHAAAMRHVAECPDCAAELALLRSLRSALDVAPEVVPALDTARISAAIAAARRPVRQDDAVGRIIPGHRRAAPGRRVAWRLAAAIAIAAAGAAGWSLLGRAPIPTTAPGHTAIALQSGLVLDGGVSDLPDSDVEELLQSLDSLHAVPDADPAPVNYHLGNGEGEGVL